MSPKVLRRKLQKKSKRLRGRRCSFCGGYAWTENTGKVYVKTCQECYRIVVLTWTGKPSQR